jgi:hypothetical protein
MASPAVSPYAKQTFDDLQRRHDARVTRIREVIIAQHWFQTRDQCEALAGMVTRTIYDLVVPTLTLRVCHQPIIEFIDDARELYALSYGMYLDLWHDVTADLKPVWEYRRIDAERVAVEAGLRMAHEVASIVEQMILDGREVRAGAAPTDWTKAEWAAHFDEFGMRVFSEAGESIVREDIDRVAGYKSPTNRKNLGTKKQTADAVAAYAGALELSPDAFLRKNKTQLNRLTLIDRD